MEKNHEFEETGSSVGYLLAVFHTQSTKRKLNPLRGVDIYPVYVTSSGLCSGSFSVTTCSLRMEQPFQPQPTPNSAPPSTPLDPGSTSSETRHWCPLALFPPTAHLDLMELM